MTKPKYLLITAFYFFSTSLFGQTNYQEVGASIGSRFSPGFVYKKQKKENRYISYDVLFSNFQLVTREGSDIGSASASFGITFEKRKDIAENAQFIHGWSPQLGLGSFGRLNPRDGLNTIAPALGYRLGFLYHLNENFYISLQGGIISRASFTFGGDSPLITNVGIAFSENANINLIYRFRK